MSERFPLRPHASRPSSIGRRTLLAGLASTGLTGTALFAAQQARSAPPAATASKVPLVVASKSDTEGALTGAMIVLALEALGLTVVSKLGLGPTLIVRNALLSGEVDLYPEYTGNGAFFTDTVSDPAWKTSDGAFAAIAHADAARGLVWLDRAPANNTWLIAVNGALARREGLATMADFAQAVAKGLIRLAASTEFVESPAALPSFEAAYGFRMPLDRIVSLPGGDTAVTARAAAQGISGVNAGMVYGTDGALDALDLVVMEDPKGAQIVYEVAPVIRAGTLARHPEIRPVLARIFTGLDAPTLRGLNARITVDGIVAETVARTFLAERGFLR